MDDDDLVARVAAGDDAALRELFGRHAPWLAVRLRAVLPAADVEDVLQETFLAAWRGAGGYRPQGACGGSGAAAAVTFGWLIPMTAVCAFALAVATAARSASAGAAAGVAAWLIIVLSGRVASGQFAAAVTDTVLFLPYLAIGAGCAAVAVYATRTPRGSLG